ncbi:MAG TPA: hypothetical protein VIL86_00455 [Tepidisphaeraceae bacterium]
MNQQLPPFRHPSFHGRIGVAREDITPPAGIYSRNWGAAQHDIADGVHRPLTLTALTLQSGPDQPPLVLMTADLGWWQDFQEEKTFRQRIGRGLGVDEARLIFSLSHTHAGPSICSGDAKKTGGALIEPYVRAVADRAVAAGRAALEGAASATLSFAIGRCALATTRDLPDPDRPRVVCGFDPNTPADDTVLVGRVTDARGGVLATLVNYACHPTTLAWDNHLISPDYVGAMRETIEAETSAPCLFFQGASGELSPREQYVGDAAIADRHGRQLGFAALSVLSGMLPGGKQLRYAGVVESGAPLATWLLGDDSASSALAASIIRVPLPIKPGLPSLADIDRQLAEKSTDRVLAERLQRSRRRRTGVGDGPTCEIAAWIWRVGDALVVAQGNEAYSLLQRSLRQKFPQAPVLVMNIANGGCGYLPPRELYQKDVYQVWQTPFAPGALEQLISSAESALRTI